MIRVLLFSWEWECCKCGDRESFGSLQIDFCPLSVCTWYGVKLVTSQYHTLHTGHARLRVDFAFAWRKTLFFIFSKTVP